MFLLSQMQSATGSYISGIIFILAQNSTGNNLFIQMIREKSDKRNICAFPPAACGLCRPCGNGRITAVFFLDA